MITRKNKREELHRTIWNMANNLRGSIDDWDFKQYVLGMLFYRYISENFVKYVNSGELEAGNADFDYAKLDDEVAEEVREDLAQSKGYFISRKAGRYYVSVVVEEKEMEKRSLNDFGIGIGLGIKELATASNGIVKKNINKTQKIKRLEKQLKREQRCLSREYEGYKKRSKNRKGKTTS